MPASCCIVTADIITVAVSQFLWRITCVQVHYTSHT